ncbi:MAG TPA: thioredoxin family protein [Dermatophilaceae bacterium]|nr:thioredoxin family protein [Dermatophilaceae bacterium]
MATTELTTATFERTVLDNDIVFVDFWATWCPPCRGFGPIFEKASEQHPDAIFGKVDTDAEQALAGALDITSIPTVMAFREGILVFAQPGALSAKDFDSVVTQVKGLDMDEVRRRMAEAQAQTSSGGGCGCGGCGCGKSEAAESSNADTADQPQGASTSA